MNGSRADRLHTETGDRQTAFSLFPFLCTFAPCLLGLRPDVFLKAVLGFLSALAIGNKRQRGRHGGVKRFGFPDVY